jgi:DNA-binding transcriptional LysR family regulator
VALLPHWMAAEAIRDGLLTPLLADWHWAMATGPEPAIWGVYAPKKTVSPKVRVFLDFMASRIGDDITAP